MNDRRTTRTAATILVALALCLGVAWLALADGADAVAWLKAQQNADGGFGAPASTPGMTADVLLAAAANGENGLDWSPAGGSTARAFLEASAASVVKAGEAAKVVMALAASGGNPRDVGGVDLVAKLESMAGEDGRIGGEGEFVNEHCYAMIALSSVRRPIPAAAVDYLLGLQIADGSWSWSGDTTAGSGDNNTAAMAVVALTAAGVPADNAQIQKAVDLFREQQNEDGGFPYVKPSPWGTDSDANSTSVVMWAMLAAGEDPAGVDWKVAGRDGYSALDRLRSFQNENGAFRWQAGMPDDNLAATVQAAMAVELKSLPLTRIDVGEAAAEPEAAGEPEVLPVTGAAAWGQVLALLGGGSALAGTGLLLRRRAREEPR